MKSYQFYTSVTMKEYNREKYWIDRDYISTYKAEAETLAEALEKYAEHCKKTFYRHIKKRNKTQK